MSSAAVGMVMQLFRRRRGGHGVTVRGSASDAEAIMNAPRPSRIGAATRAISTWLEPPMHGQACTCVPLDEHGPPDAQAEHDGLLRRPGAPPRLDGGPAKIVTGLDGRPVQLELPVTTVRVDDCAVQHVARIATEIAHLR
jgi:hypothetical protein